MANKINRIIVFSLLITSLLSLIVISLTFRYSEVGETFLFEADLDIDLLDSIAFNSSLFNVPQHIYEISISNVKAKSNPLITEISVIILINENYTDAVKGPYGTTYYNEDYAGKIEVLNITHAGTPLTCHVAVSALVDVNPTYISLATASCVLALYYLYISVNQKRKLSDDSS
jgi:hypothetical protein